MSIIRILSFQHILISRFLGTENFMRSLCGAEKCYSVADIWRVEIESYARIHGYLQIESECLDTYHWFLVISGPVNWHCCVADMQAVFLQDQKLRYFNLSVQKFVHKLFKKSFFDPLLHTNSNARVDTNFDTQPWRQPHDILYALDPGVVGDGNGGWGWGLKSEVEVW